MKNIAIVLLIFAGLLAACTEDLPVPETVPTDAAPVPAGNSPEPNPTVSLPINHPARAPFAGQLVFSAEYNGRWDLQMASPDGGAWQRLTDDGTSRSPAISRDGTRIAFESHREGNWELYSLDAASGRVTRLTRTLAFDGQPTWSPDGARIAFASTRQGNLDIWSINADGTNPIHLTPDSPAVDDVPAWSPDGRWIAFTSWRTDNAQIFIVTPDGKETINVSRSKSDDEMPTWSPDGQRIAFVSDRDGQRAIYVAEFSTAGLKNPRRLTFSGWDDAPAWSPDGKYIAFVSLRPERQPIYIVPSGGGIPVAIGSGIMRAQSPAWVNISTPVAARFAPYATAAPLGTLPSPRSAGTLIPLKDVYLAPSYGRMSDRVSDSFQALRAKVRAEAGWDFIGTLSDMARQLTGGECGDGCTNLSWHKTGRAIDTRVEIESAGVPLLEIVREDQSGETYWRIYLRTAKQDGTQGEPLMTPPWDLSNTARWTLAPNQGGLPKPIPTGYYIDFTELARAYGWNRISSYDDSKSSWKQNKVFTEYWHYQKTDGLIWYPALQELYSNQTLAAAFDWNALLRTGEDEYLLPLKGVPAPSQAWRWSLLQP